MIGSTKTWKELEAYVSSLEGEKVRGDAFEDFCKAFFLTHPVYKFKNVYKLDEFTQEIKEYLGLKSDRDIGIDGACVTENGRVIPYQAKFRIDRYNRPTQRELSTFFMISDKSPKKIVITNANGLNDEVKSRCISILGHDLDDISTDHYENIIALINGKETSKPYKFKPRNDQAKAIESAVNHYLVNNNRRGQLIVPCAVGKTLTGLWISETLGTKNTVVFTPNLSLVKQTLEAWTIHSNREIECQVLCSDESISKGVDHINEYGILNVSTNVEELADFLLYETDKPKVLFSTYQSSPLLAAVCQKTGFVFDLGIFDEAHRTTGRSDKLFSIANDDNNINITFRLFMTATQKHYTEGVKIAAENRDLFIYSMDDVESYGEVFYSMSFKEAIERDLISEYCVSVPFTNNEELKEMVKNRELILIDGMEWDAYSFSKIIALLKVVLEHDCRKIITFHNRIAHAEEFAKAMVIYAKRLYGLKLKGFHINGNMSAYARKKQMRLFEESDRAIMSAAQCLNEGVNIPVIDCAGFIDPKQSEIDIVQAVGRTLRKADNKTGPSYIVIPVMVEYGKDVKDTIEKTNFEMVWKVVDALGEHDETLSEWIANFRMALGREKKSALSRIKDIKDKIEILNLPRELDIDMFKEGLFIKVFGHKTWDFWCGLTLKYMDENYTPNIPKANYITEDGYKLGAWQSRQRTLYENKNLIRSKIDKLNSIGFDWLHINDRKWMAKYKIAKHISNKFHIVSSISWPIETVIKQIGKFSDKELETHLQNLSVMSDKVSSYGWYWTIVELVNHDDQLIYEEGKEIIYAPSAQLKPSLAEWKKDLLSTIELGINRCTYWVQNHLLSCIVREITGDYNIYKPMKLYGYEKLPASERPRRFDEDLIIWQNSMRKYLKDNPDLNEPYCDGTATRWEYNKENNRYYHGCRSCSNWGGRIGKKEKEIMDKMGFDWSISAEKCLMYTRDKTTYLDPDMVNILDDIEI